MKGEYAGLGTQSISDVKEQLYGGDSSSDKEDEEDHDGDDVGNDYEPFPFDLC